MMKLQILGTGCPKCRKLAELVEKAAQELSIEYELIKVTDINDIMSFGVMMTPALAIDDNVKFSGRIPSLTDLKGYINEKN